jgi:hypothetical protein
VAIIELDTKEISDFLKSFGPRLEKSINTRKAVTESALLVTSLIKKRTLAGKDVDSKPFKPYSPGSRRRTSRVDLSSRGDILDSIEVRIISDMEAVVGIFDPVQQRIAIVHQLGLGNSPVRRFFGVSNTDSDTMRRVLDIFTKEINKAVNKV